MGERALNAFVASRCTEATWTQAPPGPRQTLMLPVPELLVRANQLLNDAMQAYPNNPQLPVLQKMAGYTEAMTKGIAAMAAQNYNEATRQFEAALALNPMDGIALVYRTKSRNAGGR